MFINNKHLLMDIWDLYESKGVYVDVVEPSKEYEMFIPTNVLDELFMRYNEELKDNQMAPCPTKHQFVRRMSVILGPSLICDMDLEPDNSETVVLGQTEASVFENGDISFRFRIYEIKASDLMEDETPQSINNTEPEIYFSVLFSDMSKCMEFYRLLNADEMKIQLFKNNDKYGLTMEGSADNILRSRRIATEMNGTPTSISPFILEEHKQIIADNETLQSIGDLI